MLRTDISVFIISCLYHRIRSRHVATGFDVPQFTRDAAGPVNEHLPYGMQPSRQAGLQTADAWGIRDSVHEIDSSRLSHSKAWPFCAHFDLAEGAIPLRFSRCVVQGVGFRGVRRDPFI